MGILGYVRFCVYFCVYAYMYVCERVYANAHRIMIPQSN